MIYLDHGATSFPKPEPVRRAMERAVLRCANPGRGGHRPAMEAENTVFACRERAGRFFRCPVEQVVFTGSCTQGLNMAIRTLIKPGDRVLVTGFEHNAVTRPLQALGTQRIVAGRKLFDWADTLQNWEKALKTGVKAAVFTYVSNVFGYILPVEEMGALCKKYRVPFIVDAAQAAGSLPVDLEKLGADFIAMPGHKGLLGPQGTGLLLCARLPEPLLYGGTGSLSASFAMPEFLPDRAEAGTLNVPGIAGLGAGIALVERLGPAQILRREQALVRLCAEGLEKMGCRVFAGAHQVGVLSCVPPGDCEEVAGHLAKNGIAVRAGLHCAPLAHESAGTLGTGTVRLSFGHDSTQAQAQAFLRCMGKCNRFVTKNF